MCYHPRMDILSTLQLDGTIITGLIMGIAAFIFAMVWKGGNKS
ncbi:MAG: hypothetical protein ACOYD7_05365 [Raoultibacter sp.]|jgi:hypothetical protein